MKYPFHSRSCPVQPVPISVVGTKMESGWGKWGYRPQTMMLSFFFSSLLHFDSLPDTFFVFWTQEYIWVRTRPRSTGIWVQLASPSLPPSVTRCGLKWVSRGQVNPRTEGRVVVHCGGLPANLLSNHPLSPAVHLDWFPNNNNFLWYSIFIFIRYSYSNRDIFLLKCQLKVIWILLIARITNAKRVCSLGEAVNAQSTYEHLILYYSTFNRGYY